MKKSYKIISFVFGGVIILTGFFIYSVYQSYLSFLSTPLPVIQLPYKFTVKAGSGYRIVANQLKSDKMIDHSCYLDWYVRQKNLAHRLKAGRYSFSLAPTPVEFINRLIDGKVEQHRLTIIEGWTFRQMLNAVQRHPDIVVQLGNASSNEIMRRIGYPRQHPEGRFLPDTYLFPAGETDIDFLRRAYNHMYGYLHETWAQRDTSIAINTPYETLIMASIIEKETGNPHERAEISGVFDRRLKKGMRLQTDPTVIYGLGDKFDGNIRRKDLRTDTPYNTYVHFGLPPTPIALPGKDAIDAALHPKHGSSLYFVSKGDGTHYFSSTLNEHNKAIRRYQLRHDK